MSALSPTRTMKYVNHGDTLEGKVLFEPQDRQRREYGTGKPMTWDDGGPKIETKIVVQTPDGPVADYIHTRKASAVRKALALAKALDIEPGGWIKITYTHDGEGKGPIPPKEWDAAYKPPSPDDGYDPDAFGGDSPSEAPF